MSRRRRRKEAQAAKKKGTILDDSVSKSVSKEEKIDSSGSTDDSKSETSDTQNKAPVKPHLREGSVKKKEVKQVAAGVPGWVQWIVILVLVAGLGWKLFNNDSPRRRPGGSSRRIRDPNQKKGKDGEPKKSKGSRTGPAEIIGPLELGFHSDCGKSFTIDRFQVYTAFYGQGDKAGWKKKDFKTNKRNWGCSASNPKSKKGQKLTCEAGDDVFSFKFVSRGNGKKFLLQEFKMDGLDMITDGTDFNFAWQSSNTVSTFNRALKNDHFYMKETRPGKAQHYILKKGDDIFNIEIEGECPIVILKEDEAKKGSNEKEL